MLTILWKKIKAGTRIIGKIPREKRYKSFWMGTVRGQDVANSFSQFQWQIPGYAVRGFRFNMAYKIRILVVAPRD